jgi:hypothetical protein
MMAMLLKRAEELARERQRRKAQEIAAELKRIVRGASIEIEEARVLVSGRGIIKRWLIDPSLRFLAGGLK